MHASANAPPGRKENGGERSSRARLEAAGGGGGGGIERMEAGERENVFLKCFLGRARRSSLLPREISRPPSLSVSLSFCRRRPCLHIGLRTWAGGRLMGKES